LKQLKSQLQNKWLYALRDHRVYSIWFMVSPKPKGQADNNVKPDSKDADKYLQEWLLEADKRKRKACGHGAWHSRF